MFPRHWSWSTPLGRLVVLGGCEGTGFPVLPLLYRHPPFMVKITEKPTFVKIDRFDKKEYSRAGMCIALTRTNRGNLDSGYYYPSTAFALLSMISYLINPDIVSHVK